MKIIQYFNVVSDRDLNGDTGSSFYVAGNGKLRCLLSHDDHSVVDLDLLRRGRAFV
jgi:hypothetical protein